MIIQIFPECLWNDEIAFIPRQYLAEIVSFKYLSDEFQTKVTAVLFAPGYSDISMLILVGFPTFFVLLAA